MVDAVSSRVEATKARLRNLGPVPDLSSAEALVLLAMYMEHVGAEEGTDFTHRLQEVPRHPGWYRGRSANVVFSEAQMQALKWASKAF
jgi:hypothetical protein